METDPLTLLLMAGLPGAGKSTLALALGRKLGWPVLDKDTVKSRLLMLDASESLAGAASYEVLFDLANDLVVMQRCSTILDIPSVYPRVIEVGQQIVDAAGAVLQVVFCSADLETRNRRTCERTSMISQRGHPDRPPSTRWHSDGDGREYFPFLPSRTHVVTTDQPTESIVDDLLGRLR